MCACGRACVICVCTCFVVCACKFRNNGSAYLNNINLLVCLCMYYLFIDSFIHGVHTYTSMSTWVVNSVYAVVCRVLRPCPSGGLAQQTSCPAKNLVERYPSTSSAPEKVLRGHSRPPHVRLHLGTRPRVPPVPLLAPPGSHKPTPSTPQDPPTHS